MLSAKVLAEAYVGNAISSIAATLRPRLVLRLEVSCPVLLPVIALLALLHALLWLRALLLLSPLRLFALHGRRLAGVLLLPSALLLVLLRMLLRLPALLVLLRMLLLLSALLV